MQGRMALLFSLSLLAWGCDATLAPDAGADTSPDASGPDGGMDAPTMDAADGSADTLVSDGGLDTPSDAPDAFANDANCTAPAPGSVGGACTTDGQCDSATGAGDGFCLRGRAGDAVWPAEGYCVNRIDMCVVDADCGTGNLCARVEDPAGAFRVCLLGCAASGCICGPGQICQASVGGVSLQAGQMACVPGDAAAADGAACAGIADCGADSVCRDDAFEYPGGQCQRVGCSVGDDATCALVGDGHCVDGRDISAGVLTSNICVDACTTDSDCRMAEGYRCFDGGGSAGRFCRHPHAGDACAVDSDCGDAAAWDCKIGLTYPGGMCTPTTGCPAPGSATGCTPGSSACYESFLPGAVDNVCVARCGGPVGTAAGCRTGYVCRDVNPAPSAVVLGCVNP